MHSPSMPMTTTTHMAHDVTDSQSMKVCAGRYDVILLKEESSASADASAS